MIIDQARLALSTGANTSASAATPVDCVGELESLFFSWATSQVTKNVTYVVQTQGKNGQVDTLFSAVLASNASGWYHPRHLIHSSAGVAALFAAGGTSVLEKFAVFDPLVFSVTGADTGLAGSPYSMTAYLRK